MSKSEQQLYDENLEWYEKLVETNSKIDRKGATMPYTSLNGHMFSYFSKDGFMNLRLPKEECDNFIKKYKTNFCRVYGVIQKEYVVVPDKLLKNTQELKKYFDLSYAYVASLKPKPSKKKS